MVKSTSPKHFHWNLKWDSCLTPVASSAGAVLDAVKVDMKPGEMMTICQAQLESNETFIEMFNCILTGGTMNIPVVIKEMTNITI